MQYIVLECLFGHCYHQLGLCRRAGGVRWPDKERGLVNAPPYGPPPIGSLDGGSWDGRKLHGRMSYCCNIIGQILIRLVT